MSEFFGKPSYGTPEGAYSWQHLLFVILLMLTMVGLAVLLGIVNKNKDYETKNKVLIWSAFIINGFELFKIAFNMGESEDAMSWKQNLPLFLCSIQLIAIPMAAFCKGRVKEASLDFVVIFGILGAVLGTVGASQNYNAYPVMSFPNVVSGITHSISGFASLYIMISKMSSMKLKNIPILLGILFVFCVLALIANKAFNYNYMFLSYHDETPYKFIYDFVGGISFLYKTCVIVLFVLYALGFIYIFNFIKNKTKKEALVK